jgi:hypothetical protein
VKVKYLNTTFILRRRQIVSTLCCDSEIGVNFSSPKRRDQGLGILQRNISGPFLCLRTRLLIANTFSCSTGFRSAAKPELNSQKEDHQPKWIRTWVFLSVIETF